MRITKLEQAHHVREWWHGEAVSATGRRYTFTINTAANTVHGDTREEPELDRVDEAGTVWRTSRVNFKAPSALIVAARAALRDRTRKVAA